MILVRLSFILPLLIIAALTGLGATYLLQQAHWRPGRVALGGWITWPVYSAKDTDPYTAALVARHGDMPLGQGEGLVFVRERDDQGEKLSGRCHYQMTGSTPAARIWTLTLTNPQGIPIGNPSNRYALTSMELIREPSGQSLINIAPFPTGGNWLPVGSKDEVKLVLHIYDTPISSATQALTAHQLPRLHKVACL